MAMSDKPRRYSLTMSAADDFLERVPASQDTQAALAATGVGIAVIRKDSGAKRLIGGAAQVGHPLGHAGARGGHTIVTGVMDPGGVGGAGTSRDVESESASKPRSYSNCAAGGRVFWRYHASSKTA